MDAAASLQGRIYSVSRKQEARLARQGISGEILRQVVQHYGHRELFTQLLETTSANLSRYFKKPSLEEGQSEKILDTIHLFLTAEKVFGDPAMARDLRPSHV